MNCRLTHAHTYTDAVSGWMHRWMDRWMYIPTFMPPTKNASSPEALKIPRYLKMVKSLRYLYWLTGWLAYFKYMLWYGCDSMAIV